MFDILVKTVMRLQSGVECSMPGYFRDFEDCKRFYYCPHPSLKEPSGITGEEQQIMKDITLKGMECPDGTFFDESVSYCQQFVSANVIPPECKHPSIRQPFHAELKTGLVEDVQNNHHW